MGLLDIFTSSTITASEPDVSHFKTQGQEGQEHGRALGFEMYSPHTHGSMMGEYDRHAPNSERQRTAFRGLVWRCAAMRANAFASAMEDIRVQRRTGVDKYQDVEPDHPWLKLMRNPHPDWPARFIWKWTQMAKDMSKGAFFFVDRDGMGVPIRLNPVFPHFGEVRPVGSKDGGIDHFVFYRRDGGKNFPQPVDKEDVIWVRHPNPVSPYEASSLLEAAAYQIDTDLYMSLYRRDSLKNGGFPNIYLKTDQDIQERQAERAEWSFRRKYKGISEEGKFANNNRIPVLGSNLDVKMVGLSARDLEFVEGAKINRTEILQIWGIPEGLLSDRSNRANASVARDTFTQDTAQPETDDNLSQIQHDFRAAFGADDSLMIKSPKLTPLDPELQMKKDRLEIELGLSTVNDMLERKGRDTVGEEGDVRYAPSTVRSVEAILSGDEKFDQNASTQEQLESMSDRQFEALINRMVS